ncbi:MAG: phenylalanine--tRNA ligase subunit beta [Candidatus Cloacimonetes bacterium]|nr:phenylalanine--tRNA ligase subunit beta [Candidatus Cloacimonadota bacterium]
MNISYNWLKEIIDIDLSPEELGHKLTFSGIEVESVKKTGDLLNSIIIAEIIEKEKHPEADKLSVCMVFDGDNTHQVVCGAPNCAKGQKIAFAPIGTEFPDLKLKKVKLRGVESHGMICSERELGLSDEHDGILVLPEYTKIGKNLDSVLGISDTIYEVEITPNRPDLLGMVGIARDLSAQLGLELREDFNIKQPTSQISTENDKNLSSDFCVEILETELCTRYIAARIKGVSVKASPQWLIDKLNIAEIKPINNVVDITNYVMYKYGHPLHAFDSNNVKGNKIIVRKSHPKEVFPALDNNIYSLTGNELVIADTEKTIALAGVIGGKNSHITEDTTDIILEAACFNSSLTRKTSSSLKIYTDSSYRFERGMAEKTCEIISSEATELILKLAGGALATEMIDVYPNHQKRQIIALRPERARKLLAIDISDLEIVGYMERLGLKKIQITSPNPTTDAENNNILHFEIPEFRIDLLKEIDLIEEIIRLHGFEKVKSSPEVQNIMNTGVFYTRRGIKNVFMNNGFFEAVNISFSDPIYLDMLNLAEDDNRRDTVKILNPQGESFSIMRSTLLPGLLKNTLLNLNHGADSIKLFELNKVFFEHGRGKDDTEKTDDLNKSHLPFRNEGGKNKKSKLSEKWRLTGVMAGKYNPIYWKEKIEDVSFYDVKGMFDGSLLGYIGIKNIDIVPTSEPFYLPNNGFSMIQKDAVLGSFGRLDKKVLQKFDIDCDVYVFDFDFDKIMEIADFEFSKFKEIPKYPIVYRDLSFIISEEYRINDVIKTIVAVNPKIIQFVTPFDQFKGKQIPEGFRSLSINISLVSETKTLTDEQIKNIMNSIINRLYDKFKIEMR